MLGAERNPKKGKALGLSEKTKKKRAAQSKENCCLGLKIFSQARYPSHQAGKRGREEKNACRRV